MNKPPSDMQFSVGRQWVAESLDGPWYPADSEEGRRIVDAQKERARRSPLKHVVTAVDEAAGTITVGCFPNEKADE